jgi:hypothetical protein
MCRLSCIGPVFEVAYIIPVCSFSIELCLEIIMFFNRASYTKGSLYSSLRDSVLLFDMWNITTWQGEQKKRRKMGWDNISWRRVVLEKLIVCKISISHGGEYEAQNLLGCTAVFLIECRPTFQRYVLPPPSPWCSTYVWNVGRHSIKNTAVHPRIFWVSSW